MAFSDVSFRDGSAVLQQINAHKNADGSYLFTSSPDTNISTYTYAGSFAPLATPEVMMLIQGSATKTVRIREIELFGRTVTSSGSMAVILYRANDGGVTGSAILTSSVAFTHETNATASATVSYVGTADFTTNPIQIGGTGSSGRVYMTPSTSADVRPRPSLLWQYGSNGTQGLVLRGTGSYAVISGLGNIINSDITLDFRIQMTEETED